VDDDACRWAALGLSEAEVPEAADRLAAIPFLAARGATDDERRRARDADSAFDPLAGRLLRGFERPVPRFALRRP
jgi:hypothetical protein